MGPKADQTQRPRLPPGLEMERPFHVDTGGLSSSRLPPTSLHLGFHVWNTHREVRVHQLACEYTPLLYGVPSPRAVALTLHRLTHTRTEQKTRDVGQGTERGPRRTAPPPTQRVRPGCGPWGPPSLQDRVPTAQTPVWLARTDAHRPSNPTPRHWP